MNVYVTINERFKDLRVEQHLTLEELGERIGIPASTIADYEKDDYFIPHTAILEYAKYFDVSTDFLLGLTENRKHANTDLHSLHLSDEAIDVIRDKHTNTRLLSEMIAHPGFKSFLIDAEVCVDGFVHQALQNTNTFTDLARDKVAERVGDHPDAIHKALELVHVDLNDYFARLLANDMLPILDDIRKRHKNDKETADTGLTKEQLSKIYDKASRHSIGGRGLVATIFDALHITKNEKNMNAGETLLSQDHLDEKMTEDLLSQSALVEPNGRKRRRKRNIM